MNERIIQMRRVWRLSEEEVAEKLGISVEDYEELEDGTIEPSMRQAQQLSELFKVTLDYLVSGIASDRDLLSINRPLTKLERDTDALDEIKRLYSDKNFNKYKKYLCGLYHLESFECDDSLCQNWNYANKEKIIDLDDFDFLEELSDNGKIEVYHHKDSKSIDDVLHFDSVLKWLLIGRVSDPKYVDWAMKKDPVKLLNYYLLKDEEHLDKELILQCLDNGGYIQKVVDIYTVNTGDDEYPSYETGFKFGKDAFATMLLREYCKK